MDKYNVIDEDNNNMNRELIYNNALKLKDKIYMLRPE